MKSIQLSDALIENLHQVIEQHEPDARHDASITVQYLAAVVGYMMAEFPGSAGERADYLQQLHALAEHVLSERNQAKAREADAPKPPAGHIEPSATDPAMGMWRADKP